ncbi:hypothetical protein KAR48_18885 [bacterium]|nr:hypothetical protein [bacterium]
MIRTICILLLLIQYSHLQAQHLHQKVERAVAENQLSNIEGLRLKVQGLYAPATLPSYFQSTNSLPVKSATDLAYQVHHWAESNSVDNEPLFKRLVSRPSADTSFVSPGREFRVHYYTSGGNAPDMTDANNSGVPDYIEGVAQALDYSYELIINHLGFNIPPDDNNVDGPECDVYICNLGGVYGLTNFETKLADDSWITYIEMDNDFTSTPTKGLDGARVTAAHEYFHVVQFGYIGRDDDHNGGLDDIFLMEAASTWMEDFAYDDINDYLFYLPTFFNSRNVAFDYQYGLHMYGLCIWFHYLHERLDGVQFVKEFWETLINVPALEAMDQVLGLRQLNFTDEMSRFYAWNYMTGGRADEDIYYPEGATYPQISMTLDLMLSGDTSFVADVKAKAVRYYRFNREDNEVLLAVTNGQWNVDLPTTQTQLSLLRTAGVEGHTDIGGSYYAKLIHAETEIWRGVACVETVQDEYTMRTFDVEPVVEPEDDVIPPFPNPFIPEQHGNVRILFPQGDEDNEGNVRVCIFNTLGHSMRTIKMNSNVWQYSWDATDKHGIDVASGVYVVIVYRGSKRVYRQKLLVIR